MTDRRLAATPWEVEAERRRETIAADARDGRSRRSDAANDVLAPARGRRLLGRLRGSFDHGPSGAGALHQKRV
jgi:hypothetical protein